MFAVELRRHKGLQPTPVGPVEVTFEQYQILVSQSEPVQSAQMHVGYVGTQPNAPINWLRMPGGNEWPEVIKQAVREQIAAELGDGSRKEGQPPPVQVVSADPEDDDDLADDTWSECHEE